LTGSGAPSGAFGHGARRSSSGIGWAGSLTAQGSGSRRAERIAPPRSSAARARGPLLDSGPHREDRTIDLNALVTPSIGAIVLAFVVVLFFIVLVLVVLARRSRRLEARLVGLTRDSDGQSLEAVLEAHLDKVVEVARKVDDLGGRTKILETRQPRAFQRTGLVRYNPFEETGGNQSFALALLDADGDGWVLSSLHARTGTRVYAKAIVAGRSDTGLSEEEAAAIKQAMV